MSKHLLSLSHRSFILSIAILILHAPSCAQVGKERNKTINPDSLTLGEIVHDSLLLIQLENIRTIQTTFWEVNPISLDQTIENFQRDANPDKEIAIWLAMAEAYKQYLSAKPKPLSNDEKKEVFALLLSRSMMPPDEAIRNAKLELLNDKEAWTVLSLYKLSPAPIQVGSK